MKTNSQIRTWMRKHASKHVDRDTDELNHTSLVEAWDFHEGDGKATLDSNHPAWDIALEVHP